MENNNSADFQLNHDQLGHSVGQSKVRVRCPQCFKLFSISGENISEPRPRFSCTSCETQFWIPFPESLEQEELLGFPVSWLENKSEDISSHLKGSEAATPLASQVGVADSQLADIDCPKCGKKTDPKQSECKSCGVIFAQFKEQQEDLQAGFKTSRQLRDAWKILIDGFDNPELHESFIQKCQAESALDYAIYRYGRVLKACPSDEISTAMLERLEKLSMTVTVANRDKTKSGQSQPKADRQLGSKLSNLVIGIGFILMAVGYFLPTFRNIVGLGAATVFLAIAFRMYFRKS